MPTMQCELLATAATSPAHRVPCLERVGTVIERDGEKKRLVSVRFSSYQHWALMSMLTALQTPSFSSALKKKAPDWPADLVRATKRLFSLKQTTKQRRTYMHKYGRHAETWTETQNHTHTQRSLHIRGRPQDSNWAQQRGFESWN